MPRIRHRKVQAARNRFATKLKDSNAGRTVHQNVSPGQGRRGQNCRAQALVLSHKKEHF